MADERQLLSEILPGYDLGEEIGRGGWGVVFEAEHRTLERRVAIKHLPGAFGTDESARARFRSEARVVAALDHPHIVPLYDFVERDDMCVFVMELMPGGTLWDRFSEDGIRPEAACAVTMGVLGALHHAHDHGILHRDVKPENVLFNTVGRPKLADFGIAKVLGDGAGTRTATGTIMGTPAYMAPEQGSGQPVSPATDVYAVGVMLYELLSGRLPFESTGNALSQLYRHVYEDPVPLHEAAAAVPAVLAETVMRALRKAPEDRWESAAAFATALDASATAALGDDWLARCGVPVLATRSSSGSGTGDLTSGAAAAPAAPPPPSPPPAAPAPPPPVPASPTAHTPPPAGPSAPGHAQPPPAAPAASPVPSLPGPSPASPASPPAPAPAAPAPAAHPAQSAPPPQAPQAPSLRAPGHVPAAAPRPDTAGSGGGSGARRALIGALGAGVVVAVAVAAILLGGGSDPEGDDTAGSTDAGGETEVPFDRAAAEARFATACEMLGVPADLCECALDTAGEELTDEEFQANDLLIRETLEEGPDEDRLDLTVEMVAIIDRCRDELS